MSAARRRRAPTLECNIACPRHTSPDSTMGLQKAHTSRTLTPVILDLTARDTLDQERLDIPALSATNSSSSLLTLPLVAEAMVATSNLLPSHRSRTLDTVIPTDRPPHHPADFPRITSHLMSTPEHTWDLVGFQTTPIATGCPLLLLLSSPSMPRLPHLSLRILLPLLLTNIQVKHLPLRVRRPTSRCTPRIPPTVEHHQQEQDSSPPGLHLRCNSTEMPPTLALPFPHSQPLCRQAVQASGVVTGMTTGTPQAIGTPVKRDGRDEPGPRLAGRPISKGPSSHNDQTLISA